MNELDSWLFKGFGGIIDLVQQRLEQSTPISKEHFDKLDRYCNQLVEIVEANRGVRMDEEKVRAWMISNKDQYSEEYGDAVLDYLVADCAASGVDIPDPKRVEIAKEVLAS